MSDSNQTYVVMDAGSPVAAFVSRHEMKAYLRRRLDIFINPLVYTFEGHMPTIMTMSKGRWQSEPEPREIGRAGKCKGGVAADPPSLQAVGGHTCKLNNA